MIDSFILDEDYNNATKGLVEISNDIPDRYNCYKLIKRAIEIGEKTEDFSLFLSVSEKSVNKYPGNEDLQSYYVMSLLKNDKYKKAYEIANNYLVSAEFKPLLAQAVLYYNSRGANSSVLGYLNNQKEPSFYEYLASSLNDDSLLINAALLWAEQGDIEKAYNLIKNIPRQDIQEAVALLAYDSGRRSEALLRLLDLPESDSIKKYNLLLIADLFYLKENWPRSRYYYESVLEVDSANPDAYINISSIYKMNSKFKKASSVLIAGIDVFKDKVNVLITELDELKVSAKNENDKVKRDLTKRLIAKKHEELNALKISYRNLALLYHSINKEYKSDDAIRVLQEFMILFPEDVKVELLLMKSLDNVTSPDIFEAKLWKLLNEDSDVRDVSEYLIWYYLGLENYNDVNLVLERAVNRNPDNRWTNYYKGLLEGINGDYHKAIEYLDDTNLSVPQWEILYNKGIMEMALVRHSEALTLFNKSLISLDDNYLMDNRDIYRSKIKTKIAEVLISLNDIDEAIRILNQAIELDPDNYKSDLLKSVHLNIKERE